MAIRNAWDTFAHPMSTASPTASKIESREAWSGDPPHRTAARQRLLDAAERCIIRDGLGATGIAAIASEAGVSRPTVYRYFEDRRTLVFATLVRAGQSLAAGMAEHVLHVSGAAHKAVEAELFVLREVRRNTLFAEVWNSTLLDAALLADVTDPAIIAVAREGLAGLEAAAGWDDAEANEAAELMLRLLLSLLLAPAPKRSDAELRRFLERRLVPALGLSTARTGR
jgi:AcrR family transcriptional regulator